MKQMGAKGNSALRTGEDDDQRVFRPGLSRSQVSQSTPEIDDRLTALDHADGRTDLAVLLEIADKCFLDR